MISTSKMHYRTEYNLSAGDAKHCPLNNLDPNPILASIRQMASENPVVMFSMSTCCMCIAVKHLFCGKGVNATVYNLDLDPAGDDIIKALMQLQIGEASVLPVVFIGGKLVGSVERVMAAHISGSLVPLLKEAGAIWL